MPQVHTTFLLIFETSVLTQLFMTVFIGKNSSIERGGPLPHSRSIDAKFNRFIEVCHLPLKYDVISVLKKSGVRSTQVRISY